jgi:hypothetical protein
MVHLPEQPKQSLTEMVLHPFANLKAVQGLDRLPDRRVTKTPRRSADSDPLRSDLGRASSVYKALGLYAQEESRVELYENYREMDYDALIARILDAFGEDASQLSPENNRVIWVTAKNAQTKMLVERCIARGRWEERAPQVERAMARDGDVLMHLATARGVGVVATRAYEPWQVARIEDDIGRLIGFAPSDDRGNAVKTQSHTVPYWRVAHFRLQPRNLSEMYGATSSYLWGSRITWRQLQLMLDQVVIQRLLRRPDRLLVLMDTTGMSHDDAYMVCRDWERRLHREWHLDPQAGQFQNMGVPLDGAKDVVLPRGPNNATEITNFPATNTNDLLRDLDMMYRNLANGIGFPHGFLRGEGGQYNPSQSLSRQHQPFAKRASRLQRAFLHELVRVCMIDLAFQGLDVRKPDNSFTLHMAPVAPILELEHHEILQMKLDRMDRYLRLGQDYQFNQDVWVPFVLKAHGGLPDDLVSELLSGGQVKETKTGTRLRKMLTESELQDALTKAFPVAPATQMVTTNEVSDLDGWDEQVKPVAQGSGRTPSTHLVEDKTGATYLQVDESKRGDAAREASIAARKHVVRALLSGGLQIQSGNPGFWEAA